MKTLGAREVAALNWYGLKSVVTAPLLWAPVNRIVVGAVRSLPVGYWKTRLPVARDTVAFRLASGESVKLGATLKCDVARQVYWGGGRLPHRAEQTVMRVVERSAARSQLYLDIGAYTGLFALVSAVANPSIRAEAFEILPENFAVLQHNVIINNLVGRVVPRLEGVGARPGNLRMPIRTGLARLPSSLSLGSSFADGVDVPVRPLDELHASFDGNASMKIDVEGFEAEVLDGGREFIARVRPDIVCELLVDAPRTAEITAMLAPLGYRFFQFTNHGALEHAAVAPDHAGRDWLLTVDPDGILPPEDRRAG